MNGTPRLVVVTGGSALTAAIAYKSAMAAHAEATGSIRAAQALAEIEGAIECFRRARRFLDANQSGAYAKTEPPEKL